MVLPGLPWFKLSSVFLKQYDCTRPIYYTPPAGKKNWGEKEDEGFYSQYLLLPSMFTPPYALMLLIQVLTCHS